jgi:hypothetical protein
MLGNPWIEKDQIERKEEEEAREQKNQELREKRIKESIHAGNKRTYPRNSKRRSITFEPCERPSAM